MTTAERNLLRLCERVPEETFKEYYTEHSQEETRANFKISQKQLIDLIHVYNFHKPKDAHQRQIKRAKLEKYGDENYNNRAKAEKTCVEKYGVENPFQDTDNIKKSYIEKFGTNHPMKVAEIAKRSSQNHDYCEIQKKMHETYALKTGYENPFENPDVTRKSVNNRYLSGSYTNMDHTIQTCQDRYGVNYPCQTEQAMNALHSTSSNSKPNIFFSKLLEEFGIQYEREYVLGSYTYDFKVDKTLIEIDPTATHNSDWSPFSGKEGLSKDYHLRKSQNAENNGYHCIHVFDWDNVDAVVSLLKRRDVVFARKCKIKEVDKAQTKQFIDKHHIQGYANDKIRIGLYYEDELVAIMTFGEPRYNKNYEFELIRMCSSKYINGGYDKLLKWFVKTYSPKSIVSYCDSSKFYGISYDQMGFSLLKRNQPSAHWYNPNDRRHITDWLLRQRGVDQLFGEQFGIGTDNVQLMLDKGYVRVYDCGQSTYVLNL